MVSGTSGYPVAGLQQPKSSPFTLLQVCNSPTVFRIPCCSFATSPPALFYRYVNKKKYRIQ
ncbi:MAG: hypothetical protein CVU09_07725 [Bacteroidetes bacterium HGW-Bacteroidetes-4]|nr:MAG: hypothetical protein CVU09_07725 [Bacteroidetes bacterium HGW-Bacteroidetes-4]